MTLVRKLLHRVPTSTSPVHFDILCTRLDCTQETRIYYIGRGVLCALIVRRSGLHKVISHMYTLYAIGYSLYAIRCFLLLYTLFSLYDVCNWNCDYINLFKYYIIITRFIRLKRLRLLRFQRELKFKLTRFLKTGFRFEVKVKVNDNESVSDSLD